MYLYIFSTLDTIRYASKGAYKIGQNCVMQVDVIHCRNAFVFLFTSKIHLLMAKAEVGESLHCTQGCNL